VARRHGGRRRFDLIFLDPPTFSTSKRMAGTLDIQRDHVDLIRATTDLLEPDGTLIFSNNLRRFRMDLDALPELVHRGHQRQDHPPGLRPQPPHPQRLAHPLAAMTAPALALSSAKNAKGRRTRI
jgi:hypothetical protein